MFIFLEPFIEFILNFVISIPMYPIKILFIFIFFTVHTFLFAQSTYEEWMETGKYEYMKTFPYNDLKAAENAFKKAIEMNPKSYEAWYRLALTYQKMYCHEFQDIEGFKRYQAQFISDAYKKSLELSNQESDLKDLPYEPDAMINNVWGRLALAYWIYNKTDSMKWALKEMSKQYFYEPILEMAQNILNETEQNAILFINSENTYYYLLYSQIILNHRKDVKIIYFEGLNAVWYDVWLQNIYFTQLHISKDEIEENQKTQILENPLVFSHHQIRAKLEFPFSTHQTIDRANWFFYKILQHNAFQSSVYTLASFENDITRSMKNHWHIIGLNKKLYFEIPEKPYEDLIKTTNSWKFEKLKSFNGKIPNQLIKKLQFYRMPFIFYAYNNINTDNQLVHRILEVSNKILPENLLPMQKEIKDFYTQIQQATKNEKR